MRHIDVNHYLTCHCNINHYLTCQIDVIHYWMWTRVTIWHVLYIRIIIQCHIDANFYVMRFIIQHAIWLWIIIWRHIDTSHYLMCHIDVNHYSRCQIELILYDKLNNNSYPCDTSNNESCLYDASNNDWCDSHLYDTSNNDLKCVTIWNDSLFIVKMNPQTALIINQSNDIIFRSEIILLLTRYYLGIRSQEHQEGSWTAPEHRSSVGRIQTVWMICGTSHMILIQENP